MKNSLRVIRQAKGLTQGELGKRAGYSFRTISEYEKKEVPLPRPFLQEVSKVLGVTPEEIASAPELIQEETPPFRPVMLNLETVSASLLDALLKDYAQRVQRADEPERSGLAQAIVMVTAEQKRRDINSAQKVVGDLVSEVEGLEGGAKHRATKLPPSEVRKATGAARGKDA